MTVQPASARGGLVQAATRVTRISLTDLLNGSAANTKQQQALINLLRGTGTAVARVIEIRADGAIVVELGNTRLALRLSGNPAPGESLLISMENTAAPATREVHASPMPPVTAPAIAMPRDIDARADPATTRSAPLLSGLQGAAELLPIHGDDTAPATVTATPDTTVTLSPSAKLIHSIINSQSNQILTEYAPIEPLVQAEASPRELARTLQHAVRTSGLFYESHLQGWVDGRIPLKELFAEPQARVTDASAPTREPRETVHPRLEHLVRQQLDTFERQTIAWQGAVWPDQQAEIVIAAEPQTAPDSPRAWRVHLDMNTPVLGPVTVDITLMGKRLDVRLQGEAASAHTLRGGRAELIHALSGHNLDVNPIHVAGGA